MEVNKIATVGILSTGNELYSYDNRDEGRVAVMNGLVASTGVIPNGNGPVLHAQLDMNETRETDHVSNRKH